MAYTFLLNLIEAATGRGRGKEDTTEEGLERKGDGEAQSLGALKLPWL